MTLIYKINVMDWLQSEFKRNRDIHDPHRRPPKVYYQYASLDKIEEKIWKGKFFSGFTLDNSNKLFISYGSHHISGSTNCIEVIREYKGRSSKCVGFSYVKIGQDLHANKIKDVDIKTLESYMVNYFLLLPLVDQNNFNQDYAMTYDDWDVGDNFF